MPTVHYLGKILPATYYNITMWGLPTVNYRSPEFGVNAELTISVRASSVDVQCVMDRLDDTTRTHIHKIAYDLARAAVNLMSFKSGITLTVIFDQFVDVDGVTSPLAIQALNLAELCTAYDLVSNERTYGVGDIMKVVFSETALFLALDDLITSTSLHNLTTVNSARAIEGLRHAMARPNMSRSEAWELFRGNLRISEPYLRLITEHSQSGRHGEGKYVPGNITTEIIRRSWIIMNRFLEYRKRGNQPLEEEEFPMLLE